MSQQKAEAAVKNGWLANEITPIEIPQRKGDPLVFDKDEYPKAGVVAEKLGKLRPAFKKDGTVTAANASGINDGAAAVLVTSDEYAASIGATPLGRIVAYASAGVIRKSWAWAQCRPSKSALRSGWSLADVDMVEANEAFAAQSLGVMKELGLDTTR